jgi:CheY-like chemotaxis protein
LESLKKEKFDLILLDLNLPGIDGDEVLRRIKLSPQWRDIPVILVSDTEELERIKQCLELGADDYLPKPVDQTLLKSRVNGCLEKKRLREQQSSANDEISLLNEAVLALEKGQFDPTILSTLVTRPDKLGELARNLQRLAFSFHK